jgi:hypothetical protein
MSTPADEAEHLLEAIRLRYAQRDRISTQSATKAKPEVYGLRVLLSLRLRDWHAALPPDAAKAFTPYFLTTTRPSTVALALLESDSANILSQGKGLGLDFMGSKWIREYAEYPDYTLEVMALIRKVIFHPKNKTEAIESYLLIEGAEEKDEAVAAEVERLFDFTRRENRPVDGGDVKKVRQKLARVHL